MSFQSLIETDRWTAGRQKIKDEIHRRMEGLLHVSTIEQLQRQKGFIEGLNYAIEVVDPPNEDH